MRRLVRRIRLRPSRRVIGLAVAVILLVLAEEVLREHRHHFYPKRFRVVEAGAIYRGGRQTPRILRRIIREHQIQTIISLDDKLVLEDDLNGRDPSPYIAERAIARNHDVQYYGFNWNGSGTVPFEEYDKVADILATTASKPVFIHCHHGRVRTNAALAAYWIRHRGYTFEQAVERLERDYELVREESQDFLQHLHQYYEHTKAQSSKRPGAVSARDQHQGDRGRVSEDH